MTGNQFFRLNYVDSPLNQHTMSDNIIPALIASMPAAAPAAAPVAATYIVAIKIQRKFRW